MPGKFGENPLPVMPTSAIQSVVYTKLNTEAAYYTVPSVYCYTAQCARDANFMAGHIVHGAGGAFSAPDGPKPPSLPRTGQSSI